MEAYQKFDLNKDLLIKKRESERERRVDLSAAVDTLITELTKKGYQVLVSDTHYGALPESVLLSVRPDLDSKTDFFSLVRQLGIMHDRYSLYGSGESYIPARPGNLVPSPDLEDQNRF